MGESRVYSFGEGRADGVRRIPTTAERRRILGGKGAGVAEMTAAGLPVPPGFTLACEVSLQFLAAGRVPPEIERETDDALTLLERRMGRRFGDPEDPLLVSVRSGSPKSMPGMMDTILNLGLNARTVEGLARRTGNPRFAWDAYRRFVAQFSALVLGIPRARFEEVLARAKSAAGARHDHELDAETLRNRVLPESLTLVMEGGRPFPEDVREQLCAAREAVLRSWNNPRAIEYRRRFGIPDDLGTAVTVQAMVFGNTGERSATGVGFTRNPATGAREFYGEYLVNAQGEDVVAGVRTPQPLAQLEASLPEAYRELKEHTSRLEALYRWPQDFEFTIEDGKLYLLQTRDGKSTARAALRWAVEFLDAGLLDEKEALLRIDPDSLDQLLHPVFDPEARKTAKAVTRGLAAGPGAGSGAAVFSSREAALRAARGEKVVLVRPETSADDIAGMIASQGVLTATGGMTSHAAVVGRQLGKPCVVGAGELRVDENARQLRIGARVVLEGEPISLDGTSGEVFLEALPTVAADVLRAARGDEAAQQEETYRDWTRLLGLADKHRRLEVRANADKPADAQAAAALGARGIGLCRTEHMFFEKSRLPMVRRMILAAPRGREAIERIEALGGRLEFGAGRATAVGPDGRPIDGEAHRLLLEFAEPIEMYLGALDKLLPMQRADFAGLLEAMAGHPVTIRTLDPPLHEFLPDRDELLIAREALHHGQIPRNWSELGRELAELVPNAGRLSPLEQVERVLGRVNELREFNPMLGHRGCRLGITHPEITAMQARAICEAAADCLARGIDARPQVMIPLVGTVAELEKQKAIVLRVLGEVERERGRKIPLPIGTMIEVPRAALTAGEIAREAEFFSFGTNDLTQMTFGYSRDDAGRFIAAYVNARILPGDPFVSIDAGGVGRLMRIAVEDGRAARKGLELGICGEHGGDPASIALCDELGLDYVSCSPYRVPIARVAAAQAAIRREQRG